MPSYDDSTADLAPDQCWDYIRQAKIGRLAVVVAGRPEIFPINFAVDDGTVVFRTAAGTKLSAALSGSPVAFEIDGYDDYLSSAWSVVLHGTAALLETALPEGSGSVPGSEQLPLFPWQAGEKNSYVRIEPGETTGRRFLITASARRNLLRGMGLYTE